VDGEISWETLADFDGWHNDIQTVIDRADWHMCYRWSLYHRPPIAKWKHAARDDASDAVHATLPYLAQAPQWRSKTAPYWCAHRLN
jgi:salicylate hydroxylase